MNSETSPTWIGKSVKRHEDPRLLTGRGIFVDDITVPGLHHAAILRSPHAHALIKGIDATEALKLPGVFAVVTGKDVLEKTKPFAVVVKSAFKYYCAAIHKVRFV